MRLHLGEQCTDIPLALALYGGIKADGALIGALFDDLVQTVERATADKEDVGGVHLNHFLLRMLPAALRRNIGNGAFQNFQKRLLHTLAGNVPGDGGIFALAGDFVHFVDVDNAPFRQLHVKIGGLQETKQNVLHIVAHISGLSQRSGVRDGKGNVQNFRQRLGKEGLAAARWPNEQNVALLKLHIGIRAEIDTLIMVVHRDGQGDLRFVLPHDVIVHEGLDLYGCGQLVGGVQPAARIHFLPQKLAAGSDTVAADIHPRTGNQP